jgi:serine/threonine protein kinase
LSQTSQELAPGHILQGRYTIREKVGGGGMGTVYKATDHRVPNRYVAIKEMKQDNLTAEELVKARKRFLQETNILSSLQHPNLPRVHDAFDEGGHYYLVMEFIEGSTLLEQLSRMGGSPLPSSLVLDYTLQLCDVLTYLHKRQVIFRDLKPANVMITQDGRVFLIDFGIARHFKAGQTGDTEAFGTKGYIAPEVGFAQTDARADVYSLGATMHHCLTGQKPDYADQHFKFPSILPQNSHVPADLNTLILKMVEYLPQDRPKSAEKVKQQLEHLRPQVEAAEALAGSPGRRSTYSTGSSTSFHGNPTVPFNAQKTAIATTPYSKPGGSVRDRLNDVLQITLSMMQQLPYAIRPFLKTLADSSKRFFMFVILPQLVTTRQILWQKGAFYLSPTFWRQASLKATGTWTPRFLLLLAMAFIGAVLLSVFIYRAFGGLYDCVELGLAFTLLICLIVVGGRHRQTVPRNILLCTGVSISVSFLALLSQLTTDDARHPLTLTKLLVYSVATLALTALIGKATSHETAPPYGVIQPTRWFTRLSHLATAGVALICLFLQSSSGSSEQVPFISIAHPLTLTLLNTILLNDLFVYALTGIAAFSLLRLTLPFSRFDRTLLLLMSLLYLPLQYTFGLTEVASTLTKANAPTLATINMLLMVAPVVLASLALFPLRRQLKWFHQLALCTLALCSGWLQDFQAAQKPSSAFSVTTSQLTNSLLHLAALGEFVFYSMGIALAILALRALFFWMFKQYNIVDRIVVPVVACGCVLIQWAFWEAAIQQGKLNFNTEQGTRMLYADTLSFYIGWFLVLVALLAIVIAAMNTLFHLSKQYSWLEQAERLLDRATVLVTVAVVFLLLTFFGDADRELGATFNVQNLLPNTPGTVISYKSLFLLFLGLFAIITLLRRKYTIGWAERVAMLLSGVVCLLLLIGVGPMHNFPFLSVDMQQATGNTLFTVTIDSMIVTSMLAATLFSFFWLTRTRDKTDRAILALMLAIATLSLLYQYIHIQHMLLLIALIMLMLATFIAAQVERVQHGSGP